MTRLDESRYALLEAFPNVHETLNAIEIPMCIASSGPQAKILSALEKTNLDEFFSKNTFSSYDIGKWKPDPGLFLHAAFEMGVPPEYCLVVEDSAIGIAAARTAGMTPLYFCCGAPEIHDVESFDTYRNFMKMFTELSKTNEISKRTDGH